MHTNPEIAAAAMTDADLRQWLQAIRAEQERRAVMDAAQVLTPCPSTRVCERHG